MSEPWDRYSREEYLAFTRAWLQEVCRVVRPSGNLLVFASHHSLFDLGFLLKERGFRILGVIVWYKPNAQPNVTCRTLTESCEYVVWAVNASEREATGWVFNYPVAKELNAGKQLRNVWAIPTTPAREKEFGRHPNQKPLALLRRLLLLFTRPGDLVLDCFGGSGTLAVAAQETGRHWLLVERDRAYIDLAHRRLSPPNDTTESPSPEPPDEQWGTLPVVGLPPDCRSPRIFDSERGASAGSERESSAG